MKNKWKWFIPLIGFFWILNEPMQNDIVKDKYLGYAHLYQMLIWVIFVFLLLGFTTYLSPANNVKL